jgi:hypothetical protein
MVSSDLLAVLTDDEHLLVAETEADALAALDEDGTIALHTRVRRARHKYVSQYRRAAARRVALAGSRGADRPLNTRARQKAEVFELALARVSARLAELASPAAEELRIERLASAGKDASGAGPTPARAPKSASSAPAPRSAATAPTGDRALRSPATERRRAATRATGARRQARRDSR